MTRAARARTAAAALTERKWNMTRKTKLTARDIMTGGVQCIGAHQSLLDAAKMMRDLNVGCLPICGDNNRLTGLITDRDIVVQCCAEGIDPATVQAGSLAGELHWIDASSGADEALSMMEEHVSLPHRLAQIRRFPQPHWLALHCRFSRLEWLAYMFWFSQDALARSYLVVLLPVDGSHG